MTRSDTIGRAWATAGLFGGAVFLAVLPAGHITALRSLSLLVAGAAALALWSPPDRRLVEMLAAFAVWTCAAFLSLMSSRDFAASVGAMENEILRSLIVFGTFYVLARRLAAYSSWSIAAAAGLGCLSLLGIGSFGLHGEWRYHYVPPLGDFATSAIIVLPLLGGFLALRESNRYATWLMVAVITLTLIAGYLTMSRAFWLTLICQGVLAAALATRANIRASKRSFLLLAIACMAAIGMATVVASQRDRSLLYMQDRAVIYSAVVAKIPHNPVTGTGYGHETDKQWYDKAIPGAQVYHAHNIVLSYIDQMGLAGALALMAIFGVPAFIFTRALRAGSKEATIAAASGLVLLVGVFVKNNLDYFFWKQNLWLFFAHLGIYIGHIGRNVPAPLAGPSPRARHSAL